MNKVILLGIIINALGTLFTILGVLATPLNWPLIVMGIVTGLPGGFIILSGIWRL